MVRERAQGRVLGRQAFAATVAPRGGYDGELHAVSKTLVPLTRLM